MKLDGPGRITVFSVFLAVVLTGCGGGAGNGNNNDGRTSATLSSIEITPVGPVIGIDKTQQFTATGTFLNGTTTDIAASVTWYSSDATVAIISPDGLAISVADGSVII